MVFFKCLNCVEVAGLLVKPYSGKKKKRKSSIVESVSLTVIQAFAFCNRRIALSKPNQTFSKHLS